MVRFHIKATSNLGRAGTIDQWGSVKLSHCTPSCMIYLRAGHIPHLTWDVAIKQLKLDQTPIYQLTMPSLIDAREPISTLKKGVGAFCGVPCESAIHLSVHDHLTPFKAGFNDSKSIAIWTKSGKKALDAKVLSEVVRAFQCESFETLLDYDLSKEALSKRMSKSVDRSLTFYKQLFEQDEELKGDVFVSLGGGFSDHYRRKCAVDIGLQKRCDAYLIDLHDFTSGADVDKAEVSRLLQETFAPLPPGKLRFAPGAFDPTMVSFLVKNGIDMFDSTYPIMLAEGAQALKLADDYPMSSNFSLVDTSDEKFADEFSTPFPDCQCYTCQNYTLGYLNHLNNTKELLSPILLVIHNLTEYQRMFSLIRSSMDV